MKKIFIILLSFFVLKAKSQVILSHIEGTWIACNENNEYYSSDTVVLHQDVNYYINHKGCCHFVNWIVKANSIELENANSCTEPGTVQKSTNRQTIKMFKSKSKQYIQINRNNFMVDKFIMLEYLEKTTNSYPYNVKILTLKRVK